MMRIPRRPFRNARRFYRSWQNNLYREQVFYKEPYPTGKAADLVIVVGAESTATRFLTKLLVAHSDVVGESNPESHFDFFDSVWEALECNLTRELEDLFPKKVGNAVFRDATGRYLMR